MAAAVTRKRAAPDGVFPAVSGTKRPRYEFGSIYNYEKLKVLGAGSYGVVVKGRDLRTGETAAIKFIRRHGEGADHLRTVFREARCLSACSGHPSVVQIREVAADEVTQDVFIVMEFVGPSLLRLITRRFSEAETRGCMRQMLRGAEKMHGARIIHRDIKPDNILVGDDGALKICDLGMATPVYPAGTPYPEERVCTLWYRAPELLMGYRTYGTAADMWSLGCVMAELLMGVPLFEGAEDEDDMYAKVLDLRCDDDMFEGMPGLSEAGREVLCGLLRFEPYERLTAADALNHRWFAEDDAPISPAFGSPQNQSGFLTFL